MGIRSAKRRLKPVHGARTWGVIETHRSFKKTTQRLIWLALVSGLILLLVCTTADVRNYGWWDSESYIPNIIASITSFLIGAPVGLVVLATFTKERENAATLQRVNNLSRYAWYNFRDLVSEFCSSSRLTALQQNARDVIALHDKAIPIVYEYIAFMHGMTSPDQQEYGADVSDKINTLDPIRQKLIASVQLVYETIDKNNLIESEWAAIQGAWSTLDQYIRLQRLEERLKWFDAVDDRGIQKWMMRTSSPIQDFMDVHGYPAVYRSMVGKRVNVRTFFEVTEHLSQLTTTSQLYTVANYEERRAAAYNFINELNLYINHVEQQNWPESESDPWDVSPFEYKTTGARAISALSTKEGQALLEKEIRRLAAEAYHEKLRRRPKGGLSGPQNVRDPEKE